MFSRTSSRRHFRTLAATILALPLIAVFTGCAGFSSTATSPATTDAKLAGAIHGGQQPVSGAHIYLFEVGATGYGSASTNIVSTTGASGADALGNYVLSDQSGNWNIANYTCNNGGGNQTYVLATGGNPGLTPPNGTLLSNSAITLLAATGVCSNLANVPKVFVSELSTAALITATQQFFVDGSHLGSTAANLPALATALNTVADLVDLGTSVARMVNQAGTGVSPQAKLNTLGDILAPCVNSAAPTSPDCNTLFTAATPSGGTPPSTVAGAMLLIAQNPLNHVSTLYPIAAPAAPFQPRLASQPNDFALSITYSGGGIVGPTNVVVDAAGNAWIGNCPSCQNNPTLAGTDSIVGVSPAGVFLSGTAGYTTSIHKPAGLAFDAGGNLWSTNQASGATPDQVVKMNNGSVLFAFSNSNLNTVEGIAIDNSGNAWVSDGTLASKAVKVSGTAPGSVLATTADSSVQYSFALGINIDSTGSVYMAETANGNIYKFDTNGTGIYSTSSGITQPLGISIDSDNNVLTINNDSSDLSKLYGSAGTTPTPHNGGDPVYQTPVAISNAYQVSVDGANTYWIADCTGSCPATGSVGNLLHVSTNGTLIGSNYGLQDANLNVPTSSAIDPSGNVWVTNSRGASVTEFLGVAAPVRTPLPVATFAGQLGTRP